MNPKIIEDQIAYKPDIIRALIELQAHEHNLSNTRKPASIDISTSYFYEVQRQIEFGQREVNNDEEFTGFISYYMVQENTLFEEDGSNFYAYISDICVLKKFRKAGIAEKLFEKVYEDLSLKKFKGRVWINTLANNISAIKTYEKYGFKQYELIYENKI